MISQQMIHCGSLARCIEALASVRQSQIEHTANFEYAELMFKGGNWVLNMLEHVICHDKIQRGVGKRTEACAVVYYIGDNERTAFAQSGAVNLT